MSRKPYRLGSDVSDAIDLAEPTCHEVVVETAQIFDKDVTRELADPALDVRGMPSYRQARFGLMM
jgi:hypothetical protein